MLIDLQTVVRKLCCDCILFIFIVACFASAEQFLHNAKFYLSDETTENQLVGNIFATSSNLHPLNFVRAMITPDRWFRLETSGQLFTRIPIDREHICTGLNCCHVDVCLIELDAYLFSNIPTPTSVHVTVFVNDENDNPPMFPVSMALSASVNSSTKSTLNRWELAIPESAVIGSRHMLPIATDKDSPRYGVRFYQLHLANDLYLKHDSIVIEDPFTLISPVDVNQGAGKPSVPQLELQGQLDRELIENYQYYLIAKDSGLPPLSSTILINIIIQDVNDNPPMFTNLSSVDSVLKISEDVPVGTTVYRFKVFDPDQGNNGFVKLSINWVASLPGWNQTAVSLLSGKFNLHPSTGELRVMQSLDYEDESERQFTMIVEATDMGSPKLTTTTSLNIVLMDMNDNNPILKLIDPDMLDSQSETDQPKPHIILQENDPEMKLLKLISVTDTDIVSVGKIECKLGEQHETDFTLTPYSSMMYGLLNKRAFDFEREASQSGHIGVRIECTDKALPKRSIREWVQIKLGDENDNWPRFKDSNYQFYVYENMRVGEQVGKVEATDADSPEFGTVSYELSASDVNYLNIIQIDPETGVLRTREQLDRERNDRLEFHVTARDGNSQSSKTNTTGLTIIILDVNDNKPTYLGPLVVHVAENIPIGSIVLSEISYSDADSGVNASVHISLTPPDFKYFESANYNQERNVFKLIGNQTLITDRDLDREEIDEYMLTVFAWDEGTPEPLTSTTTLTVLVDDANDNHPILLHPRNNSILHGQGSHVHLANSLAVISADLPMNSLIVTISGKDSDTGLNGTVYYHLRPSQYIEITPKGRGQLKDGYEYFYLDNISGQLRTMWGEVNERHVNRTSKRNIVNKPEAGLYHLCIQLSDGGHPSLTTSAQFYINITHPHRSSALYRLFTGGNVSNTIILILITGCSLTLIISLIGAIVWVRFRRDQQGQLTRPNSNNQYPHYLGPTVINSESYLNSHNQYNEVVTDYGKYCGTLDYIGEEKRQMLTLKRCSDKQLANGDYHFDQYTPYPNDGMYREVVTSSHGWTSGTHVPMKTATFDPRAFSKIQFHAEELCAIDPSQHSNNVEWVGSPTLLMNTRYPHYVAIESANPGPTNNSTGESDSGVDIAAGLFVPTTTGHVRTSSPCLDDWACVKFHQVSTISNEHSILPTFLMPTTQPACLQTYQGQTLRNGWNVDGSEQNVDTHKQDT